MTAINPLRLDQNSGVPAGVFHAWLHGQRVCGKKPASGQHTEVPFVFIQDDWKATRKLTLNLGLEYGLEFPITERYNRKMWFDPTAELPISQAVGMPLRGGFRFADDNTRSPYDLFTKQFGPRIGLAYQLFPRTVIRSGYGLFWIPAALTEVTGDNRAPAWAINTLALASLDGGLTPYNTLDNPFPQGILEPPGSAAGLNTLIGQNAARNQRDFRSGYMQQWNFNIQQELARGAVLEVIYAGSVGTGLPAQWASQLNQLDDRYLTLGPALQELVPNPFFGTVQTGPLSQPTVQRGQLLPALPAISDALRGRYAAGPFELPFIPAAVQQAVRIFGRRRRLYDQQVDGQYGKQERLAGRRSSGHQYGLYGQQQPAARPFVVRWRCPAAAGRQLFARVPFGRGQRLLKSMGSLDLLVSGWQVSGLYTAQSGTPVAVGTLPTLPAVITMSPMFMGRTAAIHGPTTTARAQSLKGPRRAG